MELDTLPDDTAGAVRELADYDWQSPEARADVRADPGHAAQRGARRSSSPASSRRCSAGDPQAMQAVRDMLADLNALLAAHARGEDTTDQFAEFMDKHGDFFPEQPAGRRRADRRPGPPAGRGGSG